MDTITPTTEIEAVNELLNAISESDVESLDEGNADVQTALKVLRRHARSVQSRGWWFNTEEITVSPTLDPASGQHFLMLPANTLKARLTKPYQALGYVYRDGRFYDRDKNTYNITTAVDAELVLGLNFEELPEAAREFITARAGLEFVTTQMGVEPNVNFTQLRVSQAHEVILSDDIDASKPNLLLDSYTTSKIIRRRI